jgi:hypothetical protein
VEEAVISREGANQIIHKLCLLKQNIVFSLIIGRIDLSTSRRLRLLPIDLVDIYPNNADIAQKFI